ncbi:YkgJ family cysteine cluster protein [Desulfovibrio sp. JC010]|uniref:YkgJ family cysteine cluster protein n=1 Tax=Desulfovibrio sp. JC010 TaxID=2593641 RepID=UPI0013D72128|nr:YkgJ family cysteine cluster protein [Desulfovibrio sp. JC010]NDV26414.1 YkgJ family cysteine cluster protein [Desulfovibrio sp. JC010]
MNFFDYLRVQYRKWKLKKNRQAVVVRGSCNLCGSCCRSVCLSVGGRWLKSKRKFYKEIKKDTSLACFEISGKTEEGYLKFTCTRLNDNGTCSDYENRPKLCRSFPSPSIFMEFGQLPKGCGFRMSTEIDFEKVLDDAINNKEHISAGHIPD